MENGTERTADTTVIRGRRRWLSGLYWGGLVVAAGGYVSLSANYPLVTLSLALAFGLLMFFVFLKDDPVGVSRCSITHRKKEVHRSGVDLATYDPLSGALTLKSRDQRFLGRVTLDERAPQVIAAMKSHGWPDVETRPQYEPFTFD